MDDAHLLRYSRHIMLEEFGDSLIRMPPDGPPKLEHLPSPEELKGKVMLKV